MATVSHGSIDVVVQASMHFPFTVFSAFFRLLKMDMSFSPRDSL